MTIYGPISIVLGLVLLLGAVIDPRGYFTKGFEENPPLHSWNVKTPEAQRFWLALGGALGVAVGIGMTLYAY